jgi:peptidyl-prolyl cis-trans isomerase B (cyclophilin B)
MLYRVSLALLFVSLALLYCMQCVQASKGPRITHKVYFDVKHGDKDLGRSLFCLPLCFEPF